MSLKADKWTVIGGGNGGQATAGELGMKGIETMLYDINPETVIAINENGGVRVNGVIEGFGKVEATISLKSAVEDASVIIVVAPAFAHKDIAEAMAGLLQDGQLVLLHPGATFGAIEFRQVLTAKGCTADVTLAESLSLMYACRMNKPGDVTIYGIKNEMKIATLPADKVHDAVSILKRIFPQMTEAKNILETSLGNLNALMHPAPTLLNTSMIESQHEWLYYYDGITPSVGKFVEHLDEERRALGAAFGIELDDVRSMYRDLYDATGDTLTDLVRTTKAYAGIKGQKKIDTRYVLEDLPMGLVPMISLAKKAGTPHRFMDAICNLGMCLLETDFYGEGRSLENLGLDDLNVNQLKEYFLTGKLPS